MDQSIIQKLSTLRGQSILVKSHIDIENSDLFKQYKSYHNDSERQIYQSVLGENQIDKNFLVIFQGIEIIRLTKKIKQLQDKKEQDNAKKQEIEQRSQLLHKIKVLEQAREDNQQQLEKMNEICSKLYAELEGMKNRQVTSDFTLKQRYQLEKARNQQLQQNLQKQRSQKIALENQKNKLILQYRYQLQITKSKSSQHQINQLKNSYELERQQLLCEINNLKNKMNYQQNQNINLKHSLVGLENIRKYQKQSLEKQGEKLEDYENKIVLFSQQIMRLNQIIKNKEKQVQKNKQRNTQLTQQNNSMQQKILNIEHDVSIQRQQLIYWKEKCEKMQNNMQRIEKQYQENETKLSSMKQICKMKQQEVLKLQSDNFVCKGQKQRWQSQYSQKVSIYEGHIKQLNQMLSQKHQLNKKLQEKIADYQQKLRQAQIYIESQDKNSRRLEKDLQQLVQDLQTSQQQNEKMHIHILQSEKTIDNYENLEEELLQMKRANQILEQQIKKIYKKLDEKIKQLQILKQQMNKLYQKQQFYLQIDAKLRQQSHLANKLKRQLEENINFVEKLEGQLIEKDEKIYGSRNQIQVISSQKEQLSHLLRIKTQQSEQFRQQIQTLTKQLQNNRQSQRQVLYLEQKIESLQDQNKQLRAYLQQQETKNSQIQIIQKQLANLQFINRNYQEILVEFSSFKTKQNKQNEQIYSINQTIAKILRHFNELKSKIIDMDHYNKDNYENWQHISYSVATVFDTYSNSLKSAYNKTTQMLTQNEKPLAYSNIIDTPQSSLRQSYQFITRKSCDTLADTTCLIQSSQSSIFSDKIKFVLLCIQVEALRHRIGDKEAKIQELRQSISYNPRIRLYQSP